MDKYTQDLYKMYMEMHDKALKNLTKLDAIKTIASMVYGYTDEGEIAHYVAEAMLEVIHG